MENFSYYVLVVLLLCFGLMLIVAVLLILYILCWKLSVAIAYFWLVLKEHLFEILRQHIVQPEDYEHESY